MTETMRIWGISSQYKIYQAVNTLDWLIQEHTFGGFTQNYTLK